MDMLAWRFAGDKLKSSRPDRSRAIIASVRPGGARERAVCNALNFVADLTIEDLGFQWGKVGGTTLSGRTRRLQDPQIG
jgi:hypothetical protein